METKIKESTILLTAAIVGLFINSFRLIQLFGLVPLVGPDSAAVTVLDWLMRFFSFTLCSWLVLKFNLDWLDKLFETSENKGRKILKSLIAVIGSTIITLLLYYAFYPIYTLIFGVEIPMLERTGAAFGWVIVLFALLLIAFILKLQLKGKVDAIEKEHLKQEKINSELVALKNQVNPHFLFNSLNTLNFVIRNNPKTATNFVDKLSFMYRYILQSSHKGLVTLAEELEFLNSYTYLINIRYGDRFKLINNLTVDETKTNIPVLSLQILVENAVKHNEISENTPLKVSIYNDTEYISVEHEINPRSSIEKSTGNGLSNLSVRCKILMSKDIKIYKGSSFTVKLPLK